MATHGGSTLGKWLPAAWLGLFALLAIGYWWRATDWQGDSPQKSAAVPIRATSASQETCPSRYRYKPIEQIRVGEWMLADNPESEPEYSEPINQIQSEKWRVIQLELAKPDAGLLTIRLLRPLAWIEGQHLEVGQTIYMDLRELGATGNATVLEITAAPHVLPRPGPRHRLVTGTFQHAAANVLDVQVSGEEHAIGVTANHPIWSVDAGSFLPAGELSQGERVLLANNQTAQIVGITPRQTPEAVFNLEVDDQHVYFVSHSGVLVHNTYWGTARKNFWKAEATKHAKSGKYSAKNLARMAEGKAPKIKVEVLTKDGNKVVKEVSMELHHNHLPQRGGSGKAHEFWNLVPVTPWAHAGMDPFRHTGDTLLRILNGTNSF